MVLTTFSGNYGFGQFELLAWLSPRDLDVKAHYD